MMHLRQILAWVFPYPELRLKNKPQDKPQDKPQPQPQRKTAARKPQLISVTEGIELKT